MKADQMRALPVTDTFSLFHFVQYIALFFIGIANAVPMPIMGSTLSIWLAEAGFAKDSIGIFALVSIPMSLKILWTPFIDRYTLPFFKGKQRKGWVLFALAGIIACLLGISAIDPTHEPWKLSGCIATLSLFTGCLYIAGINYELESLEEKRYPMGSANVTAGYRIGLLCAGGGALLVSTIWDWPSAFRGIALLLTLGFILILWLPEPYKSHQILETRKSQIAQYPTLFVWFLKEVVGQPCRAFFRKPEWHIILMLLLLFKVGDELSKIMEGPFYLSLGFNKIDLATAAKTCGMAATILGAFSGGFFLKSKDAFTTLVKLGFTHACTLYCYYFMTIIGKSIPALYITVALEHFTGGLLMTAFIAFLWKHCDKQYAAIQYALFWSIISFKTDIMACIGGFLANNLEWGPFFLMIASIGTTASLLPLTFAKLPRPLPMPMPNQIIKG